MLIDMPVVPPSTGTNSTITYNFPIESGYNKPELSAALNRNFKIGRAARGVPALDQVVQQISALQDLTQGWNGYDADVPDEKAINSATLWIRQMCMDANSSTGQWRNPLVSADANGNVVFEWWREDKKLTVYISAIGAEYVKVWGPDIINDMSDGEVSSSLERRELWMWLTN